MAATKQKTAEQKQAEADAKAKAKEAAKAKKAEKAAELDKPLEKVDETGNDQGTDERGAGDESIQAAQVGEAQTGDLGVELAVLKERLDVLELKVTALTDENTKVMKRLRQQGKPQKDPTTLAGSVDDLGTIDD